jgi:hypothetical protein
VKGLYRNSGPSETIPLSEMMGRNLWKHLK